MSYKTDIVSLASDFEKLKTRLNKLCVVSSSPNPGRYRITWSRKYKSDTVSLAVRIIRSLELTASDAVKRADIILARHRARLEAEVDLFKLSMEGPLSQAGRQSSDMKEQVSGFLGVLVPGYNDLLPKKRPTFVLGLLDRERYCDARDLFSRQVSTFYGAMEDIKLIYEIQLLPIGERVRLRQQLADRGWSDVGARLEKADGELAAKDYQGSIGDCREVLASFVHKAAIAKVGKATNSVAGDLAELAKVNKLLTQEDKRLILALYSYLSDRWKQTAQPEAKDADLSLTETYFILGYYLNIL